MRNITTEKKCFNEKYIQPCNDKCSFCFLNYVDALQSSYIFKDLKSEEIGHIIKKVHHQVKTYKKDELIASSGDKCNSLKIIVKGAAVGEMMDFQGKSLRIEELRAPDTIASAFLFGEDNTLPVDVIAVEETKILFIPRQDLMNLFCNENTVLKNYLDIISNRAQKLTKKIKLLGLQSIRGKFANYLLEQVRREDKTEFTLKNSQSELANIFGVSRPSLGRVIREMHNEGIIEAEGRNIKIVDKKALSGLLK
ncbi:Crp/Fnr family transcriptional regulator [Mangrovibacterium diazotrophicum]|uniref:CRP-like cAMP-binding protein n=1 Tax=Mangrovibacterium diazotrophicum TaxID=1261403 RepID=A0A419W2U1_9BACT|nr:Crp/Fnr family transcriptional regulator [Mangrovibacterium diazotrophicum]RKD89788.1 CRP-like cAMP-binding protein [Mangrovibacterium diazotrophicum]